MSENSSAPHSGRPWLVLAVGMAGALLAGGLIGYALRGGPASLAQKAVQYYCPHHPAVKSDKPGSCPVCNMDLVLFEEDKNARAGREPGLPGLAAVSIPTETRQRMGLTTGAVEKRPLVREVRASARIAADETRLFKVTARIEGWVEQLFVNVTGQAVKKGDPLLAIYSPELVSAQQEYLVALKIRDRPAADGAGEDLLKAARQRLALWDISDEQIQRLEKTRAAEKTLTLHALADGAVVEKNLLAGQKIMPGEPLLVIADLASVWADADVYQSDLPWVRVGQPVEVALPFWPGKVFKGAVTFLSPTLDPATRTIKARLVIENPELLLKPGMYADARLSWPLGETLAIPESAVMRTGERVYAFKDGGEGRLIPVEIKVGPRASGWFQLLSGLAEGDKVVTSANFLVDSESSRKAALEAMGKEGPAAAPPAAPAAPPAGGHQH